MRPVPRKEEDGYRLRRVLRKALSEIVDATEIERIVESVGKNGLRLIVEGDVVVIEAEEPPTGAPPAGRGSRRHRRTGRAV